MMTGTQLILLYSLTKPYWSQVGGGSRVWSENELTGLKRSPRRNPAFKGIDPLRASVENVKALKSVF